MKLNGVREAIHDATALHLMKREGLDPFRYGCHVDRSSSGSADSIIVSSIESGRILSTIEKQQPMVRDWLLFAYGADTNQTKNRRAFLTHGLYRRFLQDDEADLPTRLTFCSLAVDDARSRYTNGRTLSSEAFCTVIGITGNIWKKNGWNKKLKKMQNQLEIFDREGLAAVEETVEQLKKGSEE